MTEVQEAMESIDGSELSIVKAMWWWTRDNKGAGRLELVLARRTSVVRQRRRKMLSGGEDSR